MRRWSLESAGRRTSFLVIGVVAIIAYVVVVAADFAAKMVASPLRAENVKLASRLDPLNAAYPHILGRIAFYERQDVPAAIQHYRAATRLNPYSARYWLDLANAQQISADVEQSRTSLERALAADPTNPQIAKEAANYYLVLGDVPAALRLLGAVVRYSPEDARAAIELSWRATQDVRAVTDQVLPPTPEAYLAFLQLLMARRQKDAAAQAWNAMMDLKQNVGIEPAFAFVDYLLNEREVPRAKAAWQQLLRHNDNLRGYLTSDNLITNPGFEEDILNGGFSWRYETTPHVGLAVDQRDAYRGRRSLTVTFEGDPVRDAGITQYIGVEPNTTYAFSAWTKTENMEGAGLPQLAILDRYSGSQLYLSPELEASSGWHRIEGEFRTTADAQVVMLRIVRVPGSTRISGRMWLDEVLVVRK